MSEVSIIVTSYNYEKYIRECVDSCLQQRDFDNFEVIVIDDGSSDSTFEILETYNHRKLRIYKIENSGIECSSNFGISKSQGALIVRVDADDKLDATFLSKMVPQLKDSEYSFAYSDYFIFDNEGNITLTSNLPVFNESEVTQRGDFLATGTLYRKADVLMAGGYSDKVKNCGLENYELILTLLQHGKIGYCYKEPLFYYRRHSLNMSKTKKDKIIKYGEGMFNRLRLGKYSTNEFHPYQLKI